MERSEIKAKLSGLEAWLEVVADNLNHVFELERDEILKTMLGELLHDHVAQLKRAYFDLKDALESLGVA